jgi:hypothetical protein
VQPTVQVTKTALKWTTARSGTPSEKTRSFSSRMTSVNSKGIADTEVRMASHLNSNSSTIRIIAITNR